MGDGKTYTFAVSSIDTKFKIVYILKIEYFSINVGVNTDANVRNSR